MTDIVSFVLNGLEDYLELERELGVRSVEVDRSLLCSGSGARAVEAARATRGVGSNSDHSIIRPFDHSIISSCPFAFIHDRPLSPKAVEMMSKIIVALGQTLETAPIAVELPLPKARFYVFLGRRALLKYLPGARAEENKWFKTPKGLDALYVKSPEDIVRYTTVTPALQKMKQDMWRALKTIAARLPGGRA